MERSERDPAVGERPAAPAQRRRAALPRLLLGLLALPLAFAFAEKWSAAGAALPLRGWAAADFLRLHTAYYLLILLWSHLLLAAQRQVWLARLLAVGLVLQVVAVDLGNSEIVVQTGALAPSGVVYYMAKAIGRLPLSIAATELLTLVVVPLLILAAFLYFWRQLHVAPGGRKRARRLAAAAAILLLAAGTRPLSPRLELNTARPSYLYHVLEFLKSQVRWPSRPAAAAQPPAPAGLEPGGPSASQSFNLVLIALESVGAGATGLYDPELAGLTPNLEALAASSWVAERAYAVVPHTSKALVAMLCGQTPYPLHPIFESTLGIPGDCLPQLLRQRGYASAFFQSPTGKFENRRALVEKMGFEHFVSGDQLSPGDYRPANYFGYEDDILLEPSRDWLRRQEDPFFAVYLTGATHHPYWLPARYGYRSRDRRNPDRDRYLNSVSYLDHFLAKVIAQYKEAGLYERTVFVVVGDHGESHGQHSRLQHNASLYEEVMRVPLLIHAPAILPAARSAALVSQLDLLPSALSLLGFDLAGESEGISQFPATAARRRQANAACWYEYWCAATVDERHKYIYNFDQKGDELYDLEADPDERRNIAAEHPEKVAALRRAAIERYDAEVARWETFLRGRDADFWSGREATLGEETRLLVWPHLERQRRSRP